MKNLLKNFTIIFFVLLLVAGLLSFSSTAKPKTEPAGISQLVQEINSGAVKEIKVRGDDLVVMLTDETAKQQTVKKELVFSKVANWPADQYAKMAYSYWTLEANVAQKELLKPVDGRLFFAGEALYTGKDTATVEGALGSGKEVAKKVMLY